jgi:predicted helicase
VTPSLAKSERADANLGRAELAALEQGLRVYESVRPRAREQASEEEKWRVVRIVNIFNREFL